MVVLDELHLMSDQNRGYLLELLVMKVRPLLTAVQNCSALTRNGSRVRSCVSLTLSGGFS